MSILLLSKLFKHLSIYSFIWQEVRIDSAASPLLCVRAETIIIHSVHRCNKRPLTSINCRYSETEGERERERERLHWDRGIVCCESLALSANKSKPLASIRVLKLACVFTLFHQQHPALHSREHKKQTPLHDTYFMPWTAFSSQCNNSLITVWIIFAVSCNKY